MISENDFINEAVAVCKNYGATGDFTVKDNDGVKLVIIKNPGWSIGRSQFVRERLNEHMLTYCDEFKCGDLMDSIHLLIY